MATGAARTVKLGTRVYPVVLPSVRDPRLHLAATILTIHLLGQTVLGFRVSVPQVVTAILTCALIEVAWVMRTSRQLVWPASAMLTGSGVALIFRWSGWSGRPLELGGVPFALVAAVSLVSKYAIRHRGEHVFNPQLRAGARLPCLAATSPSRSTSGGPAGRLDGAAYLSSWRRRAGDGGCGCAMALTFWSPHAGIGCSPPRSCMTVTWAVQPVWARTLAGGVTPPRS